MISATLEAPDEKTVQDSTNAILLRTVSVLSEKKLLLVSPSWVPAELRSHFMQFLAYACTTSKSPRMFQPSQVKIAVQTRQCLTNMKVIDVSEVLDNKVVLARCMEQTELLLVLSNEFTSDPFKKEWARIRSKTKHITNVVPIGLENSGIKTKTIDKKTTTSPPNSQVEEVGSFGQHPSIIPLDLENADCAKRNEILLSILDQLK